MNEFSQSFTAMLHKVAEFPLFHSGDTRITVMSLVMLLLLFGLVVWTAEMSIRPRQFRSDLYFALERTLRENQIVIPYPQRDVHVRSGGFTR